jgi:hypothetical protein
MAILRSYSCPRHGVFDAWEAECSHGCKDVTQVFTKAFAIKSGRTKNLDSTVRGLASDFNMTNLKSTREGEHQTGYHTRNNEPSKGHDNVNNVLWGGGGQFGGGRFNMASALAGNAVQSGSGEKAGFDPKSLGNLTGRRASVYQNDHEGLKINADSN